jgi:hypothetical protein
MQSVLPEAFASKEEVSAVVAADPQVPVEETNPAPLSGSKRRAEANEENAKPEVLAVLKKVCTSSEGGADAAPAPDSASAAVVEAAPGAPCAAAEVSAVTAVPSSAAAVAPAGMAAPVEAATAVEALVTE